MRGHLNLAGKNARANERVENVKNPHLLQSSDLDAFEVVRTYQRALEDGAVSKLKDIREANQDLLPYLNWADREYIRQHGDKGRLVAV